MKTGLQPLKNIKETRDMIDCRFSERAANINHKKIKVQIQNKKTGIITHNHSKVDTRGNNNPKCAILICTLVFKPLNQAGRVSGHLLMKYILGVCWY